MAEGSGERRGEWVCIWKLSNKKNQNKTIYVSIKHMELLYLQKLTLTYLSFNNS